MSRPELPIDWKIVDEFLACGSPGTEIASYFSMHPNTFYRKVEETFNVSFSEYCQQKKSIGDALIRKAQYEKALGLTKDGDNTLLIWLGKQRLGQSEKNEEKLDVGEQVRQALCEVFGSKGISESECNRQTEQSILHQRPDGEENKISNELGTT